jgi:hypothetical protein
VAADPSSAAAPAPAAAARDPEHTCKCQEKEDTTSATSRSNRTSLPSLSAPSRTSAASPAAERRAATTKRAAVNNPSRALVLARREALSKRGKSASTSNSTSAASVARQGNPDISSRELAQKLRELAYLNSGLTIAIHDERTDRRVEYAFSGGIANYVADLNANKTTISDVISFTGQHKDAETDCQVDLALQWNDSYSELTTCFTNTIKNRDHECLL